MGVTGLLPLLTSIHRYKTMSHYAGLMIGIDAYGWLHRAAHGCALELVRGIPTRTYIKYILQRLELFFTHGVNPYFVFDGDYLPSKAATEASRDEKRTSGRDLAMKLIATGKIRDAMRECQKSVDVTPEMARELITELIRRDIPYVVAPYEADAQLVYLERQGVIDAIMSEDSDLLVFGAARLLTKLDKNGAVVEINRCDFAACREVTLAGWTDADFRWMAILSGCDYLKSLPNIGLKKAHAMLRKHKTPERVIQMAKFEGKVIVPENYLADFRQADLTFLYQRVFCPEKKKLVFLTEPPPGQGIEDLSFIGPPVEPELARAIAAGDVNPITKLPIVVSEPATTPDSAIPPRAPDSAKRRHSQSSGQHNNNNNNNNDGGDGSGGSGGNSTSRATGPTIATTRAGRPPMRPIESYLVPAHPRVPMGEMDTNCFSVDRQRVATLTDDGHRPVVHPLPRPYIVETPPQRASRTHRRQTEPIGNLLSSHESARSFPARHTPMLPPAVSSQRPSKKARLCQDGAGEDGPASPLKSKFFLGAPSAASPLSPQQRRRTEGYLMSDSSLDEALSGLPDVDGWHAEKSRRSVHVFEESSSAAFSVFSESEGSASQAMTDATTPSGTPESDDQDGSRAAAALHEEVDSGTAMPLLPSRLERLPTPPSETPLRGFLQQFSYSPNESAMRPRPTQLPTPSSTTSAASRRASSIFTPPASSASSVASTPASDPPVGPPARRLTPLHRIAAKAMARPSRIPIKRDPLKTDRAPLGPDRKENEKPRARLPFPTNPTHVPLPRVDTEEVEALNRPCGSEDMIIPESDVDEEDEEDGDENENEHRFGTAGTARRLLGLSRFTYP